MPPEPGFLTVEWTAPAGSPGIAGALVELEGPGIAETVGAPGLELHRSEATGPLRFVVAGELRPGPVLEFRVPDRNQLPLYSVRVLEVATDDFGLADPDEYRAAVARD